MEYQEVLEREIDTGRFLQGKRRDNVDYDR
jgi:hypothetical protein